MMDSLTELLRRILHIERRVDRLESLETPTIGGGGGIPGAPNDAQYVTLALDAGLTAERVLTEGPDIDLVDTGANGTITVGRGGDKILLFDSGGNPVAEYAATSAGLVAALAAATNGDVVELPAIPVAGGPWTIPTGITLRGPGRATATLTGNLTINGVLEEAYVVGNTVIAGDASNCNFYSTSGATITLSSGTAHFCRIISDAGTWAAYTTVGAGRYGLFDCSIEGRNSAGVIGVYADNANFEMDNCVSLSSGIGAQIETAARIANSSVIGVGSHGLVHTSGTAILANCYFDAPGGSKAVNNTAGGLSVCDCRLGAVADVTLLTFLFGDRASWDTLVAGGQDNHGRDVWADTPQIHGPWPMDAGYVAVSDGSKLVPMLFSGGGGGTVSNYSEADVSNPPSWSDIVGAFGLPDAGFLGILNDNADESHAYLVGATILGWWYVNLARSAMLAAVMASILASDTFTDVSGTHLNVHTPEIGGAWTENSGSWTIHTDGVSVRQATAGGAVYIATQDAGKADLKVMARVGTSGAAGSFDGGVVFRYSDASNYWLAGINTNTGKVFIGKSVAGVWSQTDKAWTNQFQRYVAIEVTCNGNDISAIFDGGYSLSTTDAFNNTATKFGLGEYRDGGYGALGWDDFQIVDLPTYAWTRTGTVLSATVAWENSNIWEPTVIYDDNPQILTGDRVWKMWFAGNPAAPKIGYAESADGITWTKYASNPVLSGIAHISIFKSGGLYYLYGSDFLGATVRQKIQLYTSLDGINWTLDTDSVLTVGAGGAWDSEELGNTFVWKESTTSWFMFYDATDDDPSVGGANQVWRLGLATSIDGRTWSKAGGNPITGQTFFGGVWSMKADDGYYYVWGHTVTAQLGLPGYIVRYRSNDLINWERYPDFTLMPRVGAGEGENSYVGQIADPVILEHGGTAYLYFDASSDGSGIAGAFHIVLATANVRAVRGY